jgi:hypothetical protein
MSMMVINGYSLTLGNAITFSDPQSAGRRIWCGDETALSSLIKNFDVLNSNPLRHLL